MPEHFTIQGINEFYTYLKLVTPKLHDVFFKVANQYAATAESQMRSIVPVRTGYLRSTIGKSSGTSEIMVYVDAHYAGYVNFGTRKMRARPYFTGTANEIIPEFEKAFDEEVSRALSSR